jgi:hypothetical protein
MTVKLSVTNAEAEGDEEIREICCEDKNWMKLL